VGRKTAEGFVVQQLFEGKKIISSEQKHRMPQVRTGTRVTTSPVID
jgi:hypothetical protein